MNLRVTIGIEELQRLVAEGLKLGLRGQELRAWVDVERAKLKEKRAADRAALKAAQKADRTALKADQEAEREARKAAHERRMAELTAQLDELRRQCDLLKARKESEREKTGDGKCCDLERPDQLPVNWMAQADYVTEQESFPGHHILKA